MFGRLKEFRRIAPRCNRLATNFLAAVHLAAAVSYWFWVHALTSATSSGGSCRPSLGSQVRALFFAIPILQYHCFDLEGQGIQCEWLCCHFHAWFKEFGLPRRVLGIASNEQNLQFWPVLPGDCSKLASTQPRKAYIRYHQI